MEYNGATFLSGSLITPASITFQPDFTFSGSIQIGGSSDSGAYISSDLLSSWSIEGVLEAGFVSDWGVGDGEYYWYRIEGSCGESRCDTTGVVYDNCRRMTFMTIVGARNISELCENLGDPLINPRIDFRVSNIRKYSRPFERSSSDECNQLLEQEFCNIPECLDYCIDQDVRQKISFSMIAIESSFYCEMAGGIFLSGSVQTDRNRSYDPEFPVIGMGGSSDCVLTLTPRVVFGKASLSGSSLNSSTYFYFDRPSQPVYLSGFAITSSPNRNYLGSAEPVTISGTSRFRYSPSASGFIGSDGSSSAVLRLSTYPSGGIESSGRLYEYVSPFFFYSTSGIIPMSGGASYNFMDYGSFKQDAGIYMSIFGIGSESNPVNLDSGLTISNYTVSPSCGCGPLSLALPLKHNMLNSNYLSSFLKRSGLTMDDSAVLRYRSRDDLWFSTQTLAGKSRDGASGESISFSYSLSCSDGFWHFYFFMVSSNNPIGRSLRTKFAAQIPADLVCSDGSISTSMELDIGSGDSASTAGLSFPAVEPSRQTSIPAFRGVDFYVDGRFVENSIYYDEIGIFKDSYWNTNRLSINLNIPSGARMPELEIFRILS